MSSAYTQQEQFPDPAFISTSTTRHLLASTQLLVGLEPSNRMMAAATGEVGIGKTTALHACQQALEQQTTTSINSVELEVFPHTTPRLLVAQLLSALQAVTHRGATQTLMERAVSILKEHEIRLIMVDNAEWLTSDNIQALRTASYVAENQGDATVTREHILTALKLCSFGDDASDGAAF